MLLGITGGIGCGQSTVAQLFAELGAESINADKLAREIMEPGQPAFNVVVKVFGKAYLTADGRIDRKKLGGLVFGNKKQLKLLNQTVHPILIRRINQEIKRLEKQYKNKTDRPIMMLDAAILFETKMDRLVDEVIVVYAPKSLRFQRIKQRDTLPIREIELRMNAQMPVHKKIKSADFVINNSKSLKETKRQVKDIWQHLRKCQIPKSKCQMNGK
ncbi:MAG: dephospho-CoA kinase [bacterium]|nr:dephospho-CoA kinase [bacterium]